MAGEVFKAGRATPNMAAYEFLGSRRSFGDFEGDVRRAAASFTALGIGKGDRFMLSLPNVPQALVLFYALNLIGAVAVMTHPLASGDEMADYIDSAKPRGFVTLCQFYDKFKDVLKEKQIPLTLLTYPTDTLKLGGLLKYREKRPNVDNHNGKTIFYREFMKIGRGLYDGDLEGKTGDQWQDPAAVLFSGGTSGKTKGILLSNRNFNALGILTARAGDCIEENTKMLAVLPVFHGFGLGVCVHLALIHSVTCILVPKFSIKSYAKLLKRQKPNYIAGVPTLYEALLRLEGTEKIDLSMLRGVFSGGDTMTEDLRRRLDKFLAERNSPVGVREGYGLTECVTACCLTPASSGGDDETGKTHEIGKTHREGSIGLPFEDISMKIVKPETTEEAPFGETGEICVSGPTVMMCYDGDEEETKETLKTHDDGRVWLHTGDLGEIDEEGYIFFKGRLKRMIVTSGYSVYPYHIEQTIGAHPYVKQCAVIGVADDYRMETVKAIIVLRDDAPPPEEALETIKTLAKQSLAPYNRPRIYELRDQLPVTLVGKIAYTKLEEQEGAVS